MAVKTKAASAGHAAGIYADMTLDGPEIGTLVAVVDRAKNLPNRRTMGKQDPYCAMRLGKEAKKTATDRRGGQTPRWDQELRFTVHESPDYYKLKCSIFNDDKRTDLIGEVWIDLHDLIKPGGGQNDLWHQLNFKGRYAGDIRIEMTYYDTRVNADIDAEKRKQMEKTSRGSDGSGFGSAPRQLGPREIKRRPLPPGPTHFQPSELPQPLRIQPRQAQSDSIQQHAMLHQTPPRPALQQHWSAPEPAEAFDYNQIQIDPRPMQSGNFNTFEQQHDGNFQSYSPCDQIDQIDYHDDIYAMEQYEPDHQRWSDEPEPLSPQSDHSSPYSPYSSSPPVRQSPPAIREQSQQHRTSGSTNRFTTYRDSPLRQSMSQQDVPMLQPALPSTFYPDSDPPSPPPPPPPAHRNSGAHSVAPIYGTPPRASPNSRPSSNHTPIEDRSPLQMIEHQFNSSKPPSARSSGRRLSAQPPIDPFQAGPALESNQSSDGSFPMPHQLTQNYGVDFMENPIEQDQQGRYIRRNSAVEPQESPYRLPTRSQTFDVDSFDAHTYRSEPRLVKPRAVSPNAGHSVPRKSVSPHPHAATTPTRMSGVPFGPDSYEILNPSSSPSTDRGIPEQSKEAARQVEVDKLRDQGPIIGNDGRIIDPSDHLPSDTWAPEPERKQRKPEHVINIRRKGDARPPRPDSSPISIHTPPANPPLPPKPSPYQNSDPPSASSQKRNRLQKQMPSRPLPSQPFAHPHSSPSSIPQVKYLDPVQTPPKPSLPPSPYSGPPSRPPLTEYQVPASNTYNPRASYRPPQPQYPPTSSKMAPRPQSFAYGGGYGDPLAAELSMIDIGPRRPGGRTAPRPNHGFGGY